MSDENKSSTRQAIAGTVIEEDSELSLAQLCEACALDVDRIVEFVREGVLEPRGREVTQWRFAAISLRRVQVTRRLQRDLDVNLPSVGLILDLMDEIEALRNQLNRHGVARPAVPEHDRE